MFFICNPMCITFWLIIVFCIPQEYSRDSRKYILKCWSRTRAVFKETWSWLPACWVLWFEWRTVKSKPWAGPYPAHSFVHHWPAHGAGRGKKAKQRQVPLSLGGQLPPDVSLWPVVFLNLNWVHAATQPCCLCVFSRRKELWFLIVKGIQSNCEKSQDCTQA